MGATLYWTCDVPGCTAEARYVDVRRDDILPRLPDEWAEIAVTEYLHLPNGNRCERHSKILCRAHCGEVLELLGIESQGEQD